MDIQAIPRIRMENQVVFRIDFYNYAEIQAIFRYLLYRNIHILDTANGKPAQLKVYKNKTQPTVFSISCVITTSLPICYNFRLKMYGGEGGIRTLEPLRVTCTPDTRARPLRDLSRI